MNIATNVICFGAQKKFIILYLKHPFLKTNSSDVLSKESPLVSIALCYTTWTDISIVFHLIRGWINLTFELTASLRAVRRRKHVCPPPCEVLRSERQTLSLFLITIPVKSFVSGSNGSNVTSMLHLLVQKLGHRYAKCLMSC